MCAYCADPKVFSGRLRQSGLPKAPFVALNGVCFGVAHNGFAHLKKTAKAVSLSKTMAGIKSTLFDSF